MNNSYCSGPFVITGAGGGIGAQCAIQIAEAGWRELLLCDLDESSLVLVRETLQAYKKTDVETVAGDITDEGFLARLSAKLGARQISGFIHAAGIASSQTLDMDKIFEVDLDATLRLIDWVQYRMAEGGAAVLLASMGGHLKVSPEADASFDGEIPAEGSGALRHLASDANEAYFLSKRAIIATVKREARRWYREHKARLISVSPGMTDTAMMQGIDNPFITSLFESAAISRFATPSEIAAVCAFLCSPAASFITGTDLLVDGGELAGLSWSGSSAG